MENIDLSAIVYLSELPADSPLASLRVDFGAADLSPAALAAISVGTTYIPRSRGIASRCSAHGSHQVRCSRRRGAPQSTIFPSCSVILNHISFECPLNVMI